MTIQEQHDLVALLNSKVGLGRKRFSKENKAEGWKQGIIDVTSKLDEHLRLGRKICDAKMSEAEYQSLQKLLSALMVRGPKQNFYSDRFTSGWKEAVLYSKSVLHGFYGARH